MVLEVGNRVEESDGGQRAAGRRPEHEGSWGGVAMGAGNTTRTREKISKLPGRAHCCGSAMALVVQNNTHNHGCMYARDDAQHTVSLCIDVSN
jgi:hypothetical protein